MALFVAGAVAYIALRWLKKHTKFLNVAGR
jgi:hypothetical protein